MPNVGQIERITQNRVIKLLKEKLDFEYLGDWKERQNNSNIEEDILRNWLKNSQGYSQILIDKSIAQLSKIAKDQQSNLYEVNKNVYQELRYGSKVTEDTGANRKTVWFIDWNDPNNNHFSFAQEVTFHGRNTKRPDIVLYVNGIAIGVIELKRSTTSVVEGIRQNITNQKKKFIQSFFTTVQFVLAGNDTEGLRYGTTETPVRYYLEWKEESDIENHLDRALLQMLDKKRLIDLMYNFIAFDKGIKKVCRPNQYFGVKSAQDYISSDKGGILWHTQGSGKSLTMVWLSKWILENLDNSRVLIITDRKELDEQIEKVFVGVSESIERARNSKKLIELLNGATPRLMCSLVHKFGRSSRNGVNEYADELLNGLPSGFIPKGKIYIFVDECHRTQSGKLHHAMKTLLGDSTIIGFTGTPLLKKDKQSSLEVFGKFIHTYKYDQAIKDGVVLDLRYDAKEIPQELGSQDKVDQWFNVKTQGLSDYAKARLKEKWGTMQSILSSKQRLERISRDIIFDFGVKPRLQNGKGNAMLVAGSIYEACRYYEIFQQNGFSKCAVVTSYAPGVSDARDGVAIDDDTQRQTSERIYSDMLGGDNFEDYEKKVKKKFIEEPAQMKLLIVVDKLLTGFDAPKATYLYIDKSMRDHGLFQAICRVNRLDDETKDFGYIIDYKDLFKSLEQAVDTYTSEAFEDYEKDDIIGLLSDRLKKGKERIDNTLESLSNLCEPVSDKNDSNCYIQYFCGDTTDQDSLRNNEEKRTQLYKLTGILIRAYADLANDIKAAGYSQQESLNLKTDVQHYTSLKEEIKLASGDYVDLKGFEPDMRRMIDDFINAGDSKSLTSFDDFSLIDLIAAKGENFVFDLPENIKNNTSAVQNVIENNLRKVIVEEKPTNPKYYKRMSVILDEIIERKNQKKIEYEEYLIKITKLTKQVKRDEDLYVYPATINKPELKALYDNMNENEELVLDTYECIKENLMPGYKGNIIKERKLKNALRNVIGIDKVDEVFELIKNQDEFDT